MVADAKATASIPVRQSLPAWRAVLGVISHRLFTENPLNFRFISSSQSQGSDRHNYLGKQKQKCSSLQDQDERKEVWPAGSLEPGTQPPKIVHDASLGTQAKTERVVATVGLKPFRRLDQCGLSWISTGNEWPVAGGSLLRNRRVGSENFH